MSYCAGCDGYSAEVGKPNDDGLCPGCVDRAETRNELEDLREAFRAVSKGLPVEGVGPLNAARLAWERRGRHDRDVPDVR